MAHYIAMFAPFSTGPKGKDMHSICGKDARVEACSAANAQMLLSTGGKSLRCRSKQVALLAGDSSRPSTVLK